MKTIDSKNLLQKIPNVKNFSLTILSSLLLLIAFNVRELWLLGFVALVPFLFVLKNTQNTRRVVFYGFTLGLVYFSAVLSFFFSAHPLSWAGINNGIVSLISITLIWLLTSSVLALGPALWAGVIHKLRNSTWLFLLAPLFWVLTEFFQATFFSVFFAGESSLIGPHWTFGFLGYILAENIFLLSLAALGGVFILSFVVIFLNVVIYKIVQSKKLLRREVVGITLVIFLAGIFFFHSPEPTGVKNIAAFYTDFTPQFLQDIKESEKQFDEVDQMFRGIASGDEHFDIIILPENTFYLARLPGISRNYRLDSLSRNGEVVIIDSVRTDTVGPDESFITFTSSKNREVVARAKRLLVPQGEYLSYGTAWLGKLFLGNEWYELFFDKRSLERGSGVVLGYSGNTAIGALFCSEVLTPNIYRDLTKAGAEVLTNSASHSVFADSKILYQQILKYSKLRAVENSRYYIQAGNRVPSFVISNKGELLAETDTSESSVLKAAVLTHNHQTPLTTAGTGSVFFITALSFVSVLFIDRKKK